MSNTESLNCCGLPCRNADPESPYYCYKCHDTLRAELARTRETIERVIAVREQLVMIHTRERDALAAKLERAEKVLRIAASGGRWRIAEERASAYFAIAKAQARNRRAVTVFILPDGGKMDRQCDCCGLTIVYREAAGGGWYPVAHNASCGRQCIRGGVSPDYVPGTVHDENCQGWSAAKEGERGVSKILSVEEFAEVLSPVWGGHDVVADALTRHDEALRSELSEAKILLVLLQTGSCDGCLRNAEGHGFCPLCGSEARWNDAVTVLLPPKHDTDCPLGAFLARTAEVG